MNSLSILIYVVGLVTNLTNFAGLFMVLAAIAFFILMIARWMVACTADRDIFDRPGWTKTLVFWHRVVITLFVVAGTTYTFVPNRQTSIMIAASQVAEIVVKSEEAANVMKDVSGLGQDAVGLLKTYIQNEQKKLLDELKPKVENKASEEKKDI